jgi:hypothetical protein
MLSCYRKEVVTGCKVTAKKNGNLGEWEGGDQKKK